MTSPASPAARAASWRPRVALQTATQCRTPMRRASRLELADVPAVVGEPPAVQQIVDALEETGAIADVRAADVERLGGRGWTARDRKILHPLLERHPVPNPGPGSGPSQAGPGWVMVANRKPSVSAWPTKRERFGLPIAQTA